MSTTEKAAAYLLAAVTVGHAAVAGLSGDVTETVLRYAALGLSVRLLIGPLYDAVESAVRRRWKL